MTKILIVEDETSFSEALSFLLEKEGFETQVCESGRTALAEFSKENFDLLKSNIELNNIKNITILNAAVSSEDGIVSMYLNNDDAGHSMHVHGSKKIDVRSISLRNIFCTYKLEKCDFLKIDCEGAEYEIIDSLTISTIRKIERISLEYHLAHSELSRLINLKNKLNSEYIVKDYPSNNGMGILFAKHT